MVFNPLLGNFNGSVSTVHPAAAMASAGLLIPYKGVRQHVTIVIVSTIGKTRRGNGFRTYATRPRIKENSPTAKDQPIARGITYVTEDRLKTAE